MKNLTGALILLIFFHNLRGFAQQTVVIAGDSETINLGQNTLIYEDTSGILSLDQILTPEYQQKFFAQNKNTYYFGITRSVIWCKLKIRIDTPAEHFLEVSNTSLENVLFYYPVNEAKYDSVISGVFVPFDSREYAGNKNIFPLRSNAGKEQTYYLKINSLRIINFDLMVSPGKELLKRIHYSDLSHGLYFGFMVLMILYNLFIYFSVRDKSYLFYVFFVLCIGLFNGMISGSLDFLGSNNGWFYLYGDIISALAGLSGLLFCMHFLHTAENSPVFHKIFMGSITLFLLGGLLQVFGYISAAMVITGLTAPLSAILILIDSVLIYYRGFKPAIFIVIAWSILILSVIVFTLGQYGFIGYSPLTSNVNVLFFGSAFEVLLFSFALANKINVYKKEKEIAQAEIVKNVLEKEKLVTQQNILLEQKVAARTQELTDAQNQLIQNEKMAAFGVMASRVAHEIQNPLNFINNFSELAEELVPVIISGGDQNKVEAAKTLTQNLQKIRQHGKRADGIIKQLLEHSRAGTAHEFFKKEN